MEREPGGSKGPENGSTALLIGLAGPADAAELADVAAATFPLACPNAVAAEDVAAFIAGHLSRQHFADYVADPDRRVLTARLQGRIVGYAMLIRGSGTPGTGQEAVELSKMYVLPGLHGAGTAAALMEAGIAWASGCGAPAVWLGVNQKNARAQRFYRKCGFTVTGTRTFRLGRGVESDFVMTRAL